MLAMAMCFLERVDDGAVTVTECVAVHAVTGSCVNVFLGCAILLVV